MTFFLIFFTFLLVAGAASIGFFLWIYHRVIRKDTTPVFVQSQQSIRIPENFSWVVLLVLLGFQIGLYDFITYSGSEFRVPSAGWAVFASFLAASWAVLTIRRKSWQLYLLAASVAISGLGVYWHANGFVQFWNYVFALVSQVLLLVWHARESFPTTLTGWIGGVIRLLPISVFQGLRVFVSIVRRESMQRFSLLNWLKTVSIALIVLMVFLGLLSQADPVFAEIVRDFRSQIVGRTVWAIIVVFVTAVWLSCTLPKETFADASSSDASKSGWLNYRDIITTVTAVVLVLGVFVAVQFQYLFGGSRELLQQLDMTFSEYVRKGFTELLLSVFIGGIIAYVTAAKAMVFTHKQQLLTRVLNSALLIELFVLLVSALQRDFLYVEAYGLTRVRVVGGVFLGWLALFLVVLLVFSWNKIREQLSLAVLWLSAVVVLVLINVMNVDTLVAHGAPEHHEYTDYFYLMQLSEDAAEEWPEILGRMELETQELLVKETLSAEERAQLAGIKLGLISFIEARDRLYLRYAPRDWLLENAHVIGLEIPEKNAVTPYGDGWYQYANVIDTLFKSPNDLQDESYHRGAEKIIPESLEKYRTWSFSNRAEQQAFALLQENQELYFSLPKSLLHDILEYQVYTQLSLQTEENRLLHDLQYQFISVELNRYGFISFQLIEVQSSDDLQTFTQSAYRKLEEKNTLPLSQVASFTCSSPQAQTAQPLALYGVLRKAVTVPEGFSESEYKAYELRPLENTTYAGGTGPTVSLVVPRSVYFSVPEATQEGTHWNTTGLSPFGSRYYPDGNDSNEVYVSFVHALAQPIARQTSAGCQLHYTTDTIQVFYAPLY